jgi:ABC-2 type transport system permease protein
VPWGATVATTQGIILLAFAGLVGVPYDPVLLAVLVAEMALIAFVFSALGTLVASRIGQVDSFQAVLQFFVVPMFFLSGALFPLSRLPAWLAVLTKLNPLTYAVDLLRRSVFGRLELPASLAATLNPGVTWNGWRLPAWFELAVVAALGSVVLVLAAVQFSRTD